jgi:hypothetical protein
VIAHVGRKVGVTVLALSSPEHYLVSLAHLVFSFCSPESVTFTYIASCGYAMARRE